MSSLDLSRGTNSINPRITRISTNLDRPKLKLVLALTAYAILALIATFTLDGVLRTALWIFFIGLAAQTFAHSQDDD